MVSFPSFHNTSRSNDEKLGVLLFSNNVTEYVPEIVETYPVTFIRQYILCCLLCQWGSDRIVIIQ